jgi:hypothetical protein
MKTKNKTKAKQPARKKPVKRQAIKRTAPAGTGGIDLLRIADKAELQRYAAEGLTNSQARAFRALIHLEEGQKTFENFTPEDHILQAQCIRDMGRMHADAVFAGIACFVEEIAWKDQKLNTLSEAIDAMYKEYGAKDDEHWAVGEGPEEFEKLRTAFDSRFLQLRVAILRHHDEADMADLLLNDPEAYQARIDKGQKLLNKKDGIPGQAK